MSRTIKLTIPRWNALDRLAVVDPEKVYLVGGHTRTACAGLVSLGLAEQIAEVDVRAAFRITEAGRQRYKEGPPS